MLKKNQNEEEKNPTKLTLKANQTKQNKIEATWSIYFRVKAVTTECNIHRMNRVLSMHLVYKSLTPCSDGCVLYTVQFKHTIHNQHRGFKILEDYPYLS